MEGVCKKYDTGYALRNISMEICSGEFLAVMGPSGCGKTTLLRIMAGLTEPTAGRRLYRGRAITSPSRERGYVFQEPRLFPWLTVLENVELGGYGGLELLQEVGIGEFAHVYPHQLSGGMAKRAALARALAARPELLLLDEPFANLDQDTKAGLIRLIRGIWQMGTTCVIVTHDLREVAGLATGVFALARGCRVDLKEVE